MKQTNKNIKERKGQCKMTIHMTWQIITMPANNLVNKSLMATCIICLFCQIQLYWDFEDEVILEFFPLHKNVIFDGEATMYGIILRPRYDTT
jgi:hypothetical protein